MKNRRAVLKGIYRALDFVYPRNIYCIVCGVGILPDEDFSTCSICKSKLLFIKERTCFICGKPIEENITENRCPDCIARGQHQFTKGISCVEYEGQIKEIIHKFKYGKQKHLMYPLAAIMVAKLKAVGLTNVDRIIPVPLHKNRKRERGFNQAELLARVIAQDMGWKLDKESLIRIKDTYAQSDLSKLERQKNVKDAFALIPGAIFEGERLLLVDDIYTTGSTADACSRALLKGQPRGIYVISLATGTRRDVQLPLPEM